MLDLPLTSKRLALDVGRYDAFGVYRFERLAQVARSRPDLVARALDPLLPRTSTTTQGEAES